MPSEFRKFARDAIRTARGVGQERRAIARNENALARRHEMDLNRMNNESAERQASLRAEGYSGGLRGGGGGGGGGGSGGFDSNLFAQLLRANTSQGGGDRSPNIYAQQPRVTDYYSRFQEAEKDHRFSNPYGTPRDIREHGESVLGDMQRDHDANFGKGSPQVSDGRSGIRKGALGGAAAGAAAGAFLGPVGSLVGGAGGAIVGGLWGRGNTKDEMGAVAAQKEEAARKQQEAVREIARRQKRAGPKYPGGLPQFLKENFGYDDAAIAGILQGGQPGAEYNAQQAMKGPQVDPLQKTIADYHAIMGTQPPGGGTPPMGHSAWWDAANEQNKKGGYQIRADPKSAERRAEGIANAAQPPDQGPFRPLPPGGSPQDLIQNLPDRPLPPGSAQQSSMDIRGDEDARKAEAAKQAERLADSIVAEHDAREQTKKMQEYYRQHGHTLSPEAKKEWAKAGWIPEEADHGKGTPALPTLPTPGSAPAQPDSRSAQQLGPRSPGSDPLTRTVSFFQDRAEARGDGQWKDPIRSLFGDANRSEFSAPAKTDGSRPSAASIDTAKKYIESIIDNAPTSAGSHVAALSKGDSKKLRHALEALERRGLTTSDLGLSDRQQELIERALGDGAGTISGSRQSTVPAGTVPLDIKQRVRDFQVQNPGAPLPSDLRRYARHL